MEVIKGGGILLAFRKNARLLGGIQKPCVALCGPVFEADSLVETDHYERLVCDIEITVLDRKFFAADTACAPEDFLSQFIQSHYWATKEEMLADPQLAYLLKPTEMPDDSG